MKLIVAFALGLLSCVHPANAANASGGSRVGLGTSAAVDPGGRLWIAYARSSGAGAEVVLQRSGDGEGDWQAPIRVNAVPEPVAADGENRPKLAFGPGSEIYVTWTSPTSAQFTGDIRFARSLDGGKSWSDPVAVHRDRQRISHRFESLAVDDTGRVWVAWIDKRDLKAAQDAGTSYSGAAVYAAYSSDRGASWTGDFKVADGSCECCRIAIAPGARATVALMWRHVFGSNERDHAFASLDARAMREGREDRHRPSLTRVTQDRWRVDACPHHGPSLAVAADGTRHAVWFNQVQEQGRAFYGRLTQDRPSGVRMLPLGATHADVAAAGSTVAIAWKRFDGSATRIESLFSHDGGQTFSPGPMLQTAGESDQPRLVADQDILLVWRRGEDVAVRKMTAQQRPQIQAFTRETLAAIERAHAGKPFWLVLWDLECVYCMKSLQNFAKAQRAAPSLELVTIATDRISAADEISDRLQQLGVRSQAYAFADAPPEALRFAIDPQWMGEKPRAYRYDPRGAREVVSGVIGVEDIVR